MFTGQWRAILHNTALSKVFYEAAFLLGPAVLGATSMRASCKVLHVASGA